MRGSIAAIIVLGISLIVALFAGHSANAAEALKEFAATTQAYQGWIHATAQAMPEHGGRQLTVHINPSREIYANESVSGGLRIIEWIDRQHATYIQYISMNKELVIRRAPDIMPLFDDQRRLAEKKPMSTDDLAGTLIAQPTMATVDALVNYGCPVTRRETPHASEFDLWPPGQRADPKAGKPFLTLQFDKTTRLLQHFLARTSIGEVNVAYTYGGPDIKDIYDLGVPRDTAIVSRQSKVDGKASTVLDRLDKLIGANEQFGNYVAIHTKTLVTGQGDHVPLSIGIFGRTGEQYFAGQYAQLPKRKLAIAGWPNPGMPALPILEREWPDELFVSDGARSWNSLPDQRFNTRQTTSPFTYAESYMLSGKIWPGRWYLDGNMKVDISPTGDPSHPGLEITLTGRGGPFDRGEERWEFDASRNDVPTVKTERLLKNDGALGELTETRFADFAQLPSGTWYPTRWVSKTSWPDRKDTLEIEHHLQLLPDQHLDASWFCDPNRRYQK